MSPIWKDTARSFTPPIIWNTASSLMRAIIPSSRSLADSGERNALWYNDVYSKRPEYLEHYTFSRYYFLWCIIVDRLLHSGVRSVLDIGCGTGQFALLLHDKGIPRYLGIDLSEKAIQIAKSVCPDYDFVVSNIFSTDIIVQHQYDTAISLEFLEHVDNDIGVLQQIPKGIKFYGSVPNFLCESHVRHFKSAIEVAERYQSLFEKFQVDAFLADDKNKTYFLFEGIKT